MNFMKNVNIFLISLVLLTGFACKKEKYPEPAVDNSPIFYFRGTVDNTPVYIEAGIADYYMYSSYNQDSNSVYNFKGNLKKLTCNNCTGIGIQINDKRVVLLNSPSKADSGLVSGKYDYHRGAAGPSYQIKFSASYNKPAESYQWDFGYGNPVTAENEVTHTFPMAGNYYVTLAVTSDNSCYNSIRKKIQVGKNMRASITTDSAANHGLQFSQSVIGGTAPFQYLWDFGDGNTSTLANPLHNFKHLGSYFVTLRVIDAKNDTAWANYNAVTKTDKSSCAANYEIFSVTELPQDNLALSKIIITWTDANGKVYTSDSPYQPLSSYFEVTWVEEYENNENGERTKKLHVKFKCNVYNGLSALTIENGEAIICVAYK